MSKKITEQLRTICLALPEATEKEAWGDPTFRVRDKIFAMEKRGDGRVSVWLKAPESYFVPPYVGHKGWIGVRLDKRTDWDGVGKMIARSYRLVAPKRLVLRLEGGA